MSIRRVALTGGIATGKSYVLARLARHGIPTIDADRLARDAVRPGEPASRAIRERFGPAVFDAAGALDRARLGEIVFRDPDARRDLEAIVHPPVRHAIDAWFTALDGGPAPAGVADIPLLYETGRERDFDQVIVVACDPATQLRRLQARDGLTRDEAQRRLNAQWPIARKIERADQLIRTDGTFADTDRQADQIAAALA